MLRARRGRARRRAPTGLRSSVWRCHGLNIRVTCGPSDGHGGVATPGRLRGSGARRRRRGASRGRLPLGDALPWRFVRAILGGGLPLRRRRACRGRWGTLAGLHPSRVAFVLSALLSQSTRLSLVSPPATPIMAIPDAAHEIDGRAVVNDAGIGVDVLHGGVLRVGDVRFGSVVGRGYFTVRGRWRHVRGRGRRRPDRLCRDGNARRAEHHGGRGEQKTAIRCCSKPAHDSSLSKAPPLGSARR
jgi:hypothetical protein